jgi:hypothetical protein
MNKQFFLSSKKLCILIFFTIFGFYYFTYFYFLLLLCVEFVFLFLFRREIAWDNENLKFNKKVCLAPINGTVERITEINGKHKIRIRSTFIHEYGIYAPFSGEVTRLAMQENDKSSVNLELTSRALNVLELELPMKKYKPFPRLWIKTGDRFKTAACMGFLPWGGEVVISIPLAYELATQEGDLLKAGRSIIAAEKEMR